jgi:hypothetical protein
MTVPVPGGFVMWFWEREEKERPLSSPRYCCPCVECGDARIRLMLAMHRLLEAP